MQRRAARVIGGILAAAGLSAVVAALIANKTPAVVPEPPTGAAALPRGTIQVTLVEPVVAPGSMWKGDPGMQAVFTYELRNSGAEDADSLSAKLACSCQAVGKFPEQIAAGEAVRVRFRFRVPDMGVSRIAIPVQQGETQVATIDAAVEADLAPPYFAAPPESLEVTAVRGGPREITFALHTRERPGDPVWIESVELQGAAGLAAIIDSVSGSRVRSRRLAAGQSCRAHFGPFVARLGPRTAGRAWNAAARRRHTVDRFGGGDD